MRTARRFWLAVSTLSLMATPAAAAPPGPLADRVPGDAVVYLGWTGAATPNAGYETSHLKAVIDAGGAKQLVDQWLPALVRRVADRDRDAAAVIQHVLRVGGPLWRHPAAIYLGGADFATKPPTPKAALLCDAGLDAASLAHELSVAVAQIPAEPGLPPPVVKTYGTLVVVAFGTAAQVEAAYVKPPADGLTTRPRYVAAMGQVASPSTEVVAYVDVAGTVKQIDAATGRNATPEQANQWAAARDALDLAGVESAALAAGFQGRDWCEQTFVGFAPNRPPPALFRSTPLDPACLAVVPKSANSFSASRLDLGTVADGVRTVLSRVDPRRGAADYDGAVAQVNRLAGLDVRRDLLGSLGDTWVAYTDPAVGGPGLLGGVAVNKLRDPAKFDAASAQLARRAAALLATQLKGGDVDVTVDFRETPAAGTTIHYLAVPFVAPAWAVKGGNVYFGFYPQTAAAAVEAADRKGPSIADRPEYADLLRRLGDHPAETVSFQDLTPTAPTAYSSLLSTARLYLGVADLYGVPTPAMVVPPLAKLTAELDPAGSVSWSDAAGWHAKSLAPFPGSESLGASDYGSSILLLPALGDVLMPSLHRSPVIANRARSAGNEHQLGVAILLYQQDHHGQYPDTLGQLTTVANVGPDVFLQPGLNHAPPPNYDQMSATDKAKWVDDNADYVYYGKGLRTDVDASRVILRERDGSNADGGVNVLYGDGHAEYQPAAAARDPMTGKPAALPPAPPRP